MELNRRRALAGIASSLLAQPDISFAQADYPNKPIRLVHTSVAGSPADIVARLMGESIAAQLGQSVIVEAKPGGNQTIGAQDLLGARPDGYTILLSNEGMVTEVPHSTKLRFDPLKDLRALAELTDARITFIVAASVPANSVSEFVAYVKKQPNATLSCGSFGIGSLGHLSVLQFAKAAGVTLSYVPYKSALPVLQDVVGGHLPCGFVAEAGLDQFIAEGKVKCLAITGSAIRSKVLPAVPTFAEAGFPSMQQVVRFTLFVRPEVSPEIRAKLRGAVDTALKQESVVQKLNAAGFATVPQRSDADIERRLHAVYEANGESLRAVGIRPE